MPCRLSSTSVTLRGRATVNYSWGFKYGFASVTAKMTAYLDALDNLRQKEPPWVANLCKRCRQSGCSCGTIERSFVKTIESHTGFWGGSWTITYVGKLTQNCESIPVEVSSAKRDALTVSDASPIRANAAVPENLGEQRLWMVRIDLSAYEQKQCCSYAGCQVDAIYESVGLDDDGQVEYILLFSCAGHVQHFANQYGFDVPI